MVVCVCVCFFPLLHNKYCLDESKGWQQTISIGQMVYILDLMGQEAKSNMETF